MRSLFAGAGFSILFTVADGLVVDETQGCAITFVYLSSDNPRPIITGTLGRGYNTMTGPTV